MFDFVDAQILHQEKAYTRADTLRGALRPERTNFDVLNYTLSVQVLPDEKKLVGNNTITFKVTGNLPTMQLDLFQNMQVDSILYHGKKLTYHREFNAVFIDFPQALPVNSTQEISFYYSGKPTIAKNPPWDGGFIFTKDQNGKDWVSVAVQGTGASLWYPNKDHQSDEPESADIFITAPADLMAVSNGRLIEEKKISATEKQWHWQVNNPINNYNIILNVGDYVHFQDQYNELDLNYYVLSYNLQKAKKQFREVKPMMDCFYQKFGPYPFPEDSYKLVETPFLGMEHQSAVAYGNQFRNGYLGSDLSGTGIGLKWDFIIVHESGHEWFGNSITASDIADMWIHESFTAYSEAVYIECRWGKQAALNYLYGIRRTIANDRPILGDYGVNKEGSGDMYYKGANMLNTMRSIIDDDEKWWHLLKSFAKTYKHQIIDTPTVIQFFNERTQTNIAPVFKQYLAHTAIPILQLKQKGKKVFARWKTDETDFVMPIQLAPAATKKWVNLTNKWQRIKNVKSVDAIQVDEKAFYIQLERITE